MSSIRLRFLLVVIMSNPSPVPSTRDHASGSIAVNLRKPSHNHLVQYRGARLFLDSLSVKKEGD